MWEIGSVHSIEIKWTAVVLQGTSGLYVSSYVDPEGERHYMAATQFETAGARKMFPCFDEPGYKSYFTFTVYYKHADYNAVWNMPVAETGPAEGNPGYYYAKYDTSMKISPYLLALAISDYDYSSYDYSAETK